MLGYRFTLALATAVFAGVAFGVAVLAMTGVGTLLQRRRRTAACESDAELLQVGTGPPADRR